MDTLPFLILHAARMKGIVAEDALALLVDVRPDALPRVIDDLAGQGLIARRETPRLSGWSLTERGRDRHAELLFEQRSDGVVDALAHVYERFLELNQPVKVLCSAWQRLTQEDAAGRWEAVEELTEIHVRADQLLEGAAAIVPRFSAYRSRLATAVERVKAGDQRFFTDALVDSYHTVWFECHEDFLMMLGRDRLEEEG